MRNSYNEDNSKSDSNKKDIDISQRRSPSQILHESDLQAVKRIPVSVSFSTKPKS